MKHYQEDSDRIGIKFHIKHGNQSVLCFISGDALQDQFPETHRFEDSFVFNKEKIENKALDKIRKGDFSPTGEVVIVNADFP